MAESLFGEGPTWVPFPEPVHVEAGKHYEVGLEDGVPYVREVASGGVTFALPGTLTKLSVYLARPVHWTHGMDT